MSRLKILITSVGSLVGQNILDVLECRRDAVHVAGLDANAENPRVFRCDAAYLVPPVDQRDAFRARLLAIVDAEMPDILLTGRDHDAFEVGMLFREEPRPRVAFPYGDPAMSRMMHDKWESWEFAERNGLPFAESVLTGTSTAADQARALAARYGLPLVTKPRLGYGSLGVRLLLDGHAVQQAASIVDHVIQPFLGPPAEWAAPVAAEGPGIPIFTTYRDDRQYSCQVIIGPDGSFAAPFCMMNLMVNGKSERNEICRDPDLHHVVARFAAAVSRRGWYGPFNLQCRRLADGSFCGFEMNGRLTGATSARAWLGYDEVGLLVQQFVPGRHLPPHPTVTNGVVMRFLTSYGLAPTDVRHLQTEGSWRAPDRR